MFKYLQPHGKLLKSLPFNIRVQIKYKLYFVSYLLDWIEPAQVLGSHKFLPDLLNWAHIVWKKSTIVWFLGW